MKKLLFTVLLVIFANRCNNYDLLEKIQDPGGKTEQFTTNNYIFVSSWLMQGDLSYTPFPECNGMTGTPAADCSCTRAAAANGLRKGPSHQFIAVLSTGSPSIYDALCKIQNLPQGGCAATDPNPWYNTAGETVAPNLVSLFGAANPIAIRYSENKSEPGTNLAWTGSTTGGINSSSNCSNWTSTSNVVQASGGNRIGLSGQWLSDGSSMNCDTTQRVYCAGRL